MESYGIKENRLFFIIDLGLFSTNSLVETVPNHKIEMRTQMRQSTDENRDHGKNVWACISHPSNTTIAKYGKYQVSGYKNECIKKQGKMLK